jgi:hypothetical protein
MSVFFTHEGQTRQTNHTISRIGKIQGTVPVLSHNYEESKFPPVGPNVKKVKKKFRESHKYFTGVSTTNSFSYYVLVENRSSPSENSYQNSKTLVL